ncbi:hypothetical protein O3G_MSEX007042 [Manduca sexta]|uniref:Saccharopine dehydrogenase NADP binding domain-containing protein n=2 Tax=Manduca sexta TaxID=7130 RepID=A0A921Z5K6_MANSE|nr:hypothetical protein O3G_MSEX007042 [Manduca sexta]
MDKIDILVLGATGYTGRFVTSFFARVLKDPEYSDIKWGICGRSKEKLEILKSEICGTGTDESIIVILECDITNKQDLKNATQSTKIIVNCTGPFEILGDSVLNSCIETGTHYVDISAELHQMLSTYHKYNKLAEDANVLIVPSCGFASIPAEIGLMYLEKHFAGLLKTVECYIRLDMPKKCQWGLGDHCLVHYGTWESLVHVLHKMPKTLELRKETLGDIIESEPPELKRSFLHRKDGNFWFPYPGPDTDVTNMSQKYLHEKKQRKHVYVKNYCLLPKLFHFLVIMGMYLYYYLSRFKCFRNQLWKHPKFYSLGFFSHKGPSEKNRKGTHYSFTLTGKGWDHNTQSDATPNKSLSVKVSGIDPGYETTALALGVAAITLLKEYPKMPKGGVVMPGAAFRETNIIDRLNNNGMKFEIL